MQEKSSSWNISEQLVRSYFAGWALLQSMPQHCYSTATEHATAHIHVLVQNIPQQYFICPAQMDPSYSGYSCWKPPCGTGGSPEPPVPVKGVQAILAIAAWTHLVGQEGRARHLSQFRGFKPFGLYVLGYPSGDEQSWNSGYWQLG